MVNLEWYRTFKMIYRTGTLTEAASRLNMTQPGVSGQLVALEAYVGHKLFERTARRMVPTDYAKRLYTQIAESVEQLEDVERKFKKASLNKSPTIHVGVPHEFFSHRAVEKLTQLKCRLNIQFGLTEELLARLNKGDLDLVVATQKVRKYPFIYQELLREQLLLVGSENIDRTIFDDSVNSHNLVGAEQWLLTQEWYAYSGDLALIRRYWWEHFKKRPLIHPRHIIPDLRSIVRLLTVSPGLSIIPHYLCTDELQNGRLLELGKGLKPVTNTLYFVLPKGLIHTQLIDEIIQAFGQDENASF